MENNNKKVCKICGMPMTNYINNIPYCKRHYLQIKRHGKILNRTIYEPNEWKVLNNYAICITYNKYGIPNNIVKVDIDKMEELKRYKIYCRKHDCGKQYACLSINGKKVLLHRYLMNVYNKEYTLNSSIDHINGDSLDNRMSNLRICSHKDNMKNIKKGDKIIGVYKSPNKNNKWIARIMSNYKTIDLGYFNTFEEAVIARLTKEKELCNEYGPNSKLYYLLDYPSPIKELKNVLERECNRIG